MQPKEKKRSRKEQGLNPVPLLLKRQLWPPGHLKLRDCLIQPITANPKNEETTSKWLVFDQNSGRRHRRQFKFNRDFVVVSSTTSLSASSTTSSTSARRCAARRGQKVVGVVPGGWQQAGYFGIWSQVKKKKLRVVLFWKKIAILEIFYEYHLRWAINK